MGQHEGRLNESESRIWDRCYRYFVRTGKWIFEEALKRKENKMGMTKDGKIDTEGDVFGDQIIGDGNKMIKPNQLFETAPPENWESEPLNIIEENGLMAKPEGYPGASRDFWLECHTFLCARSGCAANKKSFGKGKCTMPSLIAIDSHGRCTGYHPRNKKNWKNAKKM